MRRIASHLALLPTGIIDRPLLTLDGRRIVSIGRYDDGELDRMEGIEFYAGILIPGMVDAHCHLELSYLRGAIAPGGGFAAFAAGMARERGRFSDVERFEAMRRADRELWEGGVDARRRHSQRRDIVCRQGREPHTLPHLRRGLRAAHRIDGAGRGAARQPRHFGHTPLHIFAAGRHLQVDMP